ncbi:MAG: ABC transporter permease [Solobacterium sp.]|nr:ABC transporter permease [Solobacterium sp.]
MLKRIYRSIFNRLRQTSLLLVVMFVISLLLCVTFSVKNVSDVLNNKIAASVNPVVSINASNSVFSYLRDYDSLRKIGYQEYCEMYYEDYYQLIDELKPQYYDLNMTITNQSLVSYSDEGLLYDVADSELLSKIKRNKVNEEDIQEKLSSLDGWLSGKYERLDSIPLCSTNKSEFTDLHYHFNEAAIEEGRIFNDDEIDNGASTCVLTSNIFLYKDGSFTKVEVGDYIKYSIAQVLNGEVNIYEEYEFEVIGILNGDKYRNHNDDIGRSYVIIPEKTLMEIYEDVKSYKLSEFDYIKTYPSIITLNSFNDIDKFVEKIGELNEFGDRNYKYETALDAYYGFAGNLDTLSLNSDILFKFSFVVSILLTIFIVSLDLNRRKKEIGLLASLGESKVAIMVQLVLEYLIIIVFTMIIAAFVSNIISNQFIDKIDLNPEVSDIFNDKTLDYSDSISILNNAKLAIDFVDLIKICLIQTVVILFTIILSAIQIFTIKVRKIMIDE